MSGDVTDHDHTPDAPTDEVGASPDPADVEPEPTSPTPAPAESPAPTPAEGAPAPDDASDNGTSGAPETSEVAAGPDDEPAASELTVEQVDALVAERDEFLDQLRRTAAEFDNFRKQSQKRLIDEVARSQGSFVERLLPVLDAIEAAQAHGSTDIEAVATQLFGFLEKEGLSRVAPTGEVFDPNVADAVIHEPSEGDEPIVTEVLRTGYLWNGRVIRPAMVRVAG